MSEEPTLARKIMDTIAEVESWRIKARTCESRAIEAEQRLQVLRKQATKELMNN